MMAEAEGLVNTLDKWRVVDKLILSTKTPEKKRIFGKGNFEALTGRWLINILQSLQLLSLSLNKTSASPPAERIRKTAGIDAVFVNVERLSPLSEVS